MRVSSVLVTLLFSYCLSLPCRCGPRQQDYTWTLSGELDGTADSNFIYVAVTSDSTLMAATVEVHYDTTLLEFIPYPPDEGANYLTGRVTVSSVAPTVGDNGESCQGCSVRLGSEYSCRQRQRAQVQFQGKAECSRRYANPDNPDEQKCQKYADHPAVRDPGQCLGQPRRPQDFRLGYEGPGRGRYKRDGGLYFSDQRQVGGGYGAGPGIRSRHAGDS